MSSPIDELAKEQAQARRARKDRAEDNSTGDKETRDPTSLELVEWMLALLAIKLPWPPAKKAKKPSAQELAERRRFDLRIRDWILDTLARAGDTLFDKSTRQRIRERLGLTEKLLGPELTRRRREIERERQAAQAEGSPVGGTEPERESGEAGQPGYFASRGRLFRREKERSYPLSDFDAWIAERVRYAGGLDPRNELIVVGRTPETLLPRVSVPYRDFEAMKWPVEAWGDRARIYAGRMTRDHVRMAIMSLPKVPIVERTIHESTGWETINGQLLYRHGRSGAIGKRGAVKGVSVELCESLARHGLSLPGAREELSRAVRASLELFGLAPMKVMAPVMGITYETPLAEFVGEIDLVVYLHGGTQAFKSETAALAQGHVGNYTRETLPLTFRATTNYIDSVLFAAKDSLVVVDNYRPAADDQERRRNAEKVNAILYGKGDRAGRGRLDRNSRQKPTYYPRAAVIITGEILPTVGSALGRALLVSVKATSQEEGIVGDVDELKLTAAQDARGLYPVAMGAYIRWIAANEATLRDALPRRFADLRDSLRGRVKFRQAEQFAHLMVGLETFMKFAVEAEATSSEERARLLADASAALTLLAEESSALTAGASPVATFRSFILDGFASQRIYLERLEGGSPDNGAACGWNRSGEFNYLPQKNPPRRIGFIDDGWVYFITTEMHAYVEEVGNRTKRALGVGQQVLYQLLDERRLIEVELEERTSDGKPGVVRRLTKNVHIPALGGKARVLKIVRSFFWIPEEGSYEL